MIPSSIASCTHLWPHLLFSVLYPDISLKMRNTELSFSPFCPRSLLAPSFFLVLPCRARGFHNVQRTLPRVASLESRCSDWASRFHDFNLLDISSKCIELFVAHVEMPDCEVHLHHCAVVLLQAITLIRPIVPTWDRKTERCHFR